MSLRASQWAALVDKWDTKGFAALTDVEQIWSCTRSLIDAIEGGCNPGNGRSREGIRKAEAIALILEDFGLEPEHFRLELIPASESPMFARVVEEMTEELYSLGPNPYK